MQICEAALRKRKGPALYQEHECFEKPNDPESKIWRYSDLGKFLSILDKSALWFSRADKLGDPYEASWLPYLPQETRNDHASDVFRQNRNRMRPFQLDTTGINCWHMNEHQSAAMWHVYVSAGQGVAIQSTFRRLTECFGDCPQFVSVGLVNYIDYTSDAFRGSKINGFQPFLHKRKSYAYEKEVRAIAWPPGGQPRDLTPIQEGISVPVDLNVLVERVYVAPTAAPWMLETVVAIMDKYEFKKDVCQSDLLARPLY